MDNFATSTVSVISRLLMNPRRPPLLLIIGFGLWSVLPIFFGYQLMGQRSAPAIFLQLLAFACLASLFSHAMRIRVAPYVFATALTTAWLAGVAQMVVRSIPVVVHLMGYRVGVGSPASFLLGVTLEVTFWVFPTTVLFFCYVAFLRNPDSWQLIPADGEYL